jgi:steroid 5-alpha reductase family enzyme
MFLHAVILSALFVFCYMTLFFLFAFKKRNNSIADIAWGLGFVLIAFFTLVAFSTYSARQLLVTLLTAIWGLRLAGHIIVRNWGKEEDPRYQEWRRQWGNRQLLYSYTHVFLLQGALILIISLPIIAINSTASTPLNILDLIGLTLWLIGFAWEVIGDRQLANFLKKPANKGLVMQQGLWRYTRHPNYFGESLMWWSIFIISCAQTYSVGLVISPLLITYLLVFVSGIPLAEKHLEKNRGFAEYKRKTSPFIPWFPAD